MRTSGFTPATYCATIERVRRDQVQVGQVIQSSHGYRLLISEVRDDAPNRSDDRSVELRGYLHAHLHGPFHNEIYTATVPVAVEQPDSTFRVPLMTTDGKMTWDPEVRAMNPAEAVAQAIVIAADMTERADWALRSAVLVIA